MGQGAAKAEDLTWLQEVRTAEHVNLAVNIIAQLSMNGISVAFKL